MTTHFSPWLVRLLLAALLAYGSEILLWTNPPGRALLDIALLIPGYLVLSTLLLDIAVRYRLRDLWGLMLLAGVYGLLAGALLNPQTTLIDLPRTLVTRVMGAHTLLGLEMIGLFLALTNGQSALLRRLLLIGGAIVGLAWGIWVRWSAAGVEVTYSDVALQTMLVYGAFGLLICLLLYTITRAFAAQVTADDLMLSVPGFAVLVLALAVLLFVRIVQDSESLLGLALTGILLGFCLTILWFRRNRKFPPLLDNHLPLKPLSLVWIGIGALIFFAAGVFAYDAPLIGTPTINQLAGVVLGFTLYGVGWLPTVSAVLGVRAYTRQVATQKL